MAEGVHETQMQRLLAQYARIKEKYGLLKKAYLEQKDELDALVAQMGSKRQGEREAAEEIDRLSYHNQRLTKLCRQLQAQVTSGSSHSAGSGGSRRGRGPDSRGSGGGGASGVVGSWFGGGSSALRAEVAQLREQLQVTQDELSAKIAENEALHIRHWEATQEHKEALDALTTKLARAKRMAAETEEQALADAAAASAKVAALTGSRDELQADLAHTKHLLEQSRVRGDALERDAAVARSQADAAQAQAGALVHAKLLLHDSRMRAWNGLNMVPSGAGMCVRALATLRAPLSHASHALQQWETFCTTLAEAVGFRHRLGGAKGAARMAVLDTGLQRRLTSSLARQGRHCRNLVAALRACVGPPEDVLPSAAADVDASDTSAARRGRFPNNNPTKRLCTELTRAASLQHCVASYVGIWLTCETRAISTHAKAATDRNQPAFARQRANVRLNQGFDGLAASMDKLLSYVAVLATDVDPNGPQAAKPVAFVARQVTEALSVCCDIVNDLCHNFELKFTTENQCLADVVSREEGNVTSEMLNSFIDCGNRVTIALKLMAESLGLSISGLQEYAAAVSTEKALWRQGATVSQALMAPAQVRARARGAACMRRLNATQLGPSIPHRQALANEAKIHRVTDKLSQCTAQLGDARADASRAWDMLAQSQAQAASLRDQLAERKSRTESLLTQLARARESNGGGVGGGSMGSSITNGDVTNCSDGGDGGSGGGVVGGSDETGSGDDDSLGLHGGVSNASTSTDLLQFGDDAHTGLVVAQAVCDNVEPEQEASLQQLFALAAEDDADDALDTAPAQPSWAERFEAGREAQNGTDLTFPSTATTPASLLDLPLLPHTASSDAAIATSAPSSVEAKATQSSYELTVMDESGAQFDSLNISLEDKAREVELREFYQAKVGHLLACVQQADGKAMEWHERCQVALRELDQARCQLEAHEARREGNQQTVAELEEQLAATESNYQGQMTVMSEHLVKQNDRLAAADELVERLKAHRVLCGRCKTWNTVGWLLTHGDGGKRCQGGRHSSGYSVT